MGPGMLLKMVSLLIMAGFSATSVYCTYRQDLNTTDDDPEYTLELKIKDRFGIPAHNYSSGEKITFQLILANLSYHPLFFEFDSSQTYEFEVYDSTGKGVWQWSTAENITITEGYQLIKVDARDSWIVEVNWDQTDQSGQAVPPGRYRIKGQFIGLEPQTDTISLLE